MPPKDFTIGNRPTEAERWVQRGARRRSGTSKAAQFTARLTIDVTPALRTRIKLAAIAGQVTAAELLRALLEREFPADLGS